VQGISPPPFFKKKVPLGYSQGEGPENDIYDIGLRYFLFLKTTKFFIPGTMLRLAIRAGVGYWYWVLGRTLERWFYVLRIFFSFMGIIILANPYAGRNLSALCR
jgi:hypothetical protein